MKAAQGDVVTSALGGRSGDGVPLNAAKAGRREVMSLIGAIRVDRAHVASDGARRRFALMVANIYRG